MRAKGLHPGAGMTVLEIMIALSVLAISLLGLLSMMLVTETFNESAAEDSLGYKACQEVMEQILATSIANVPNWNGYTFVATKLHPTAVVGGVQVVAVDPESPDAVVAGGTKMYRITVSLSTWPPAVPQKLTRRPVSVNLVSWRSNP